MTRLKWLARSRWARLVVVLGVATGVAAILIWDGPSWSLIGDAFTSVIWVWVFAAIGLNLLSVIARSIAWRIVIDQALDPPRPKYPLVFSAFSIGLFANAVLPGRIGELARVAVLSRKLPTRFGKWATLVGTVFAHRVFDLVPVLLLIVYVALTARIPTWAVTSLVVVVIAGVGLIAFAIATAKRSRRSALEELGAVRRVLTMARQGLAVMRSPVGAAEAILFQILGWLCQIFAVWTAMRAFEIHLGLPAAGLVLVVMNVATMFPLWPGNVGLVQGAIALSLSQYGVSYATGFAYGIGLQAIEASVGVGAGLVFLAREGLSFAMLRVMPDASQAEMPESEPDASDRSADEPEERLVGERSG
ncbi:MAG: lysylphosphatidylglycerol synthase transmembrane domain-containing protein [Gaiellaceae bacterium]